MQFAIGHPLSTQPIHIQALSCCTPHQVLYRDEIEMKNLLNCYALNHFDTFY